LEHIPMEPLTFLYAVKHVLKVIEDVWSIDRDPPCFLYAVLHV
jgi:hypothetical protein